MNAIKAYGAQLLVSPPGVREGDANHYMMMATIMCKNEPDMFFDMNQYDNMENPEAHYDTLGPEIWSGSMGQVTHFVAAGSTGGTISGTGKFLKEMNPKVKVVLADPIGSVFAEYFRTKTLVKPEKFLVEGVGKGSIPGAMNFDVVDKVLKVTDEEAFRMCHYLAQKEGICAGGSSGLNVFAALRLAGRQTQPCTIVTVMPDLGIKYLSKVYNAKWLEDNNINVENIGTSKY